MVKEVGEFKVFLQDDYFYVYAKNDDNIDIRYYTYFENEAVDYAYTLKKQYKHVYIEKKRVYEVIE